MSAPLSMLDCFADLEDPRIERTKRHPLLDAVGLAVLAVIGGAEGWEEIKQFGKDKHQWLKRFLRLPNGIPSHDTISRVFRLLNPEALQAAWTTWINSLPEIVSASEPHAVAIDGKTMRCSRDGAAAALHMISAWSVRHGLALGQRSVDAHSNEITAIPLLLQMLSIKGAIVSIDAMGCQSEIAQQIVKQQGDYVLSVKDNQPTLHEAIDAHFLEIHAGESAAKCLKHYTIDRSHGREVERYCYVTAAPETVLKAGGKFPRLQSVCEVITITRRNGKETIGTRHFITSLPPKVKQIAAIVRGHWQIENSLHWSLDVTFREDDSRIRKGFGASNFGILRRFALSLIKQHKGPGSVRRKRKQAGWNNAALATIERINV